MSVAAIICEYNPFHAGHRWQIDALRRRLGADTGVICLMSGHYVQRGEPAVFDKWARAETAVAGGADLVLELPLTVAVQAAGYFASGAVDCLEKLCYVDFLCFGSETGSAETLAEAARLMETAEYHAALRDILSQGVSYARARETALRALGGDGGVLAEPNSALGVDYLRRLLETDGRMRPLVLRRDGTLPSATALRAALTAQNAAGVHTLKNGERAMLAVLRTLPDEAFAAMPFGSEGLWSKVMKACRRENSMADILTACKSKRYAMSRLKRGLLCLYLGLSAADLEREIPYLRVLAFNHRGRAMLHGMKETSHLPLISGNVPDTPEARAYFALECRAADLYGLFGPAENEAPTGTEQTRKPIYVKRD